MAGPGITRLPALTLQAVNDALIKIRQRLDALDKSSVSKPASQSQIEDLQRQLNSIQAQTTSRRSTSAAGNAGTSLLVSMVRLTSGSASTVDIVTTTDNAVIDRILMVIDEAFDGTPTVEIGAGADADKYAASTAFNLALTPGTVVEILPGLDAAGVAENLAITFTAGGATLGSARFLVHYVPFP